MRRAFVRLVGLAALIAALPAHPDAQNPFPYPPVIDGAREVVFKQVDGVDLKLWIFEPANHRQSDKSAAVVFFFGGGWQAGSPGQFVPQARRLSELGMVAIVADYRVSSRNQTKPSAAVADGKFEAGTKVSIIRDAGSYTLVRSEDGVEAYVSSDALGDE